MENAAMAVGIAVIALLLMANMALSWWQGRQEQEVRKAIDSDIEVRKELHAALENFSRQAPDIAKRLDEVREGAVADWNAIQNELAVLDGRLGTVERRFGPLAPLEQRVDEAPETESGEPKPAGQDVKHAE